MTPTEWARKHATPGLIHEQLRESFEQAIREAYAEAREAAAKVAEEYDDWTYWGQDANAIAASKASHEIAKAIRLGRALTVDEIREVDRDRAAILSRTLEDAK